MLSSPASGNYLFHGGTVTSVYLGQTNRERIVTSPPFCLCLCRRFRLAGCRIQGPRAELCLLTEHTLRMQPDIKSLPTWQIPASRSPPHKPTQPLQKSSILCLWVKEDGLLLGPSQAWQHCSLIVHLFQQRWKERPR